MLNIHNTMELKELKSLLHDMLEYRKYGTITSAKAGQVELMIARDLPAGHVKFGSIAIYGIYVLTTSKSKEGQKTLDEIYKYIEKNKLTSSMITIGILFNIPKYMQNLSYKKGYTYEKLTYLDLAPKHNLNRCTGNYEIVSKEMAEIVRGKNNVDIPRVLNSDIMSKYLGAKIGDYIKFSYMNNGEAGPVESDFNIVIVVRSEKNIEKPILEKPLKKIEAPIEEEVEETEPIEEGEVEGVEAEGADVEEGDDVDESEEEEEAEEQEIEEQVEIETDEEDENIADIDEEDYKE